MLFLALVLVFSSVSGGEPVAVVTGKKIFEKDIPENLNLDQYLQNIVFLGLAKEKGYDDSVKAGVDRNFEQEIVKRTMREFSRKASEPTLYELVLFSKNSKKHLELQIIQTETFSQALQAYIEVLKGKDFGDVSEKYSFANLLTSSLVKI